MGTRQVSSIDKCIDWLSEVDYSIEENENKRIGILGGNFNPPHLGHLIIADQVGKQLNLDEVRLMPSNEPPHIDHKETIASYDREMMVRLAINDNPLLGIETIEFERDGKSYTIDTVKALKERYPTNEFYFIIGADMVEYLPKWRDIDQLMELIQFVAVKRPGYKEDTKYPVIWIDTPLIDISSTNIRQRVKQQQSICYLVPLEVEHYINQMGLYHD